MTHTTTPPSFPSLPFLLLTALLIVAAAWFTVTRILPAVQPP